MSELIIPDACEKYIRMQRSRYSENKVPHWEEAKRRYSAHVAEDFAGMLPWLPYDVKNILEIGCGVGALAVYLCRYYPGARLELLDGDMVTREGGAGYSSTPDVYNSRFHTEMLLAANDVCLDRWHDIGTTERLEADLIVSLGSFGYHYPLTSYRVRGFVIADLRRGVEEVRGEVIFKGPKYDRCAFEMDSW